MKKTEWVFDGQFLRMIQAERNISNMSLALSLSVSKITVCRWRQDVSPPSDAMIKLIAKYFKVNVSKFMKKKINSKSKE